MEWEGPVRCPLALEALSWRICSARAELRLGWLVIDGPRGPCRCALLGPVESAAAVLAIRTMEGGDKLGELNQARESPSDSQGDRLQLQAEKLLERQDRQTSFCIAREYTCGTLLIH